MTIKFLPQNDGVDHINIYSKGKTELGRLLTNFAHTPTHTSYGHFNSLEGYWFYLKSEVGAEGRENLRHFSGFQAKELGSSLPINPKYDEVIFRRLFREAMLAKLKQHENIQDLMRESILPFTHYYVYKEKKQEAGHVWITEYWELLRFMVKAGNL